MLLSVYQGTNIYAQFFTVLIIFIFVLAITWFTTKWISNYQKGKSVAGNIEVLESARVGNNKYVEIVRIGERYAAIAIGKDTVTMLMELSEGDITLSSDSSQVMPDFKGLLEKIQNKSTAEDEKKDE